MATNFARGLITGTIIGAAVGMIIPSRTNARLRRKAFKNGRSFMRRAGNLIEDIVDMW